MDTNFDEDLQEQQNITWVQKLMVKLNLKKPKVIKNYIDEINHLKF